MNYIKKENTYDYTVSNCGSWSCRYSHTDYSPFHQGGFSISEHGIPLLLRHLWGRSHLSHLRHEMLNWNVLWIFQKPVASISTPQSTNAMMISTARTAQSLRFKMAPKWTWQKQSYSLFFATIQLPANVAYVGQRALNVLLANEILRRHPSVERCSCEHLAT